MEKSLPEELNKPNYYAIIPANVRYDKNLNPLQKLLYSEISALCNQEGYCWASSQYFANIYGVTRSWVSVSIKKLEDKGYITIVIDRKAKNQRKIYIGGVNKSEHQVLTKVNTNIIYNNISNISKEILQENPVKEKILPKPPVVKKENRQITNLVNALCQILNVPKLEGTVKDNRYMARHLLADIEKAKIPIPQFFECFTNCVEDTREFRTTTSLREIRNKFPKIMKMGSDMRARGYQPGHNYVKYHCKKGDKFVTTENFLIDVEGNKIEQVFTKAPIEDFDPEFLKGRGII